MKKYLYTFFSIVVLFCFYASVSATECKYIYSYRQNLESLKDMPLIGSKITLNISSNSYNAYVNLVTTDEKQMSFQDWFGADYETKTYNIKNNDGSSFSSSSCPRYLSVYPDAATTTWTAYYNVDDTTNIYYKDGRLNEYVYELLSKDSNYVADKNHRHLLLNKEGTNEYIRIVYRGGSIYYYEYSEYCNTDPGCGEITDKYSLSNDFSTNFSQLEAYERFEYYSVYLDSNNVFRTSSEKCDGCQEWIVQSVAEHLNKNNANIQNGTADEVTPLIDKYSNYCLFFGLRYQLVDQLDYYLSDKVNFDKVISNYKETNPSIYSNYLSDVNINNYTEKKNFIQKGFLNEYQNYCDNYLQNVNVENVGLLTNEYSCLNMCVNLEGEDINTSKCGISGKLVIWIANIIRWVKYIIPVAVIVLGILDFMKAMGADKDDEMKKAQGRFVKRLIAAALIFIAPLIIEFVLDKMGFISNECGIIDL